MKKISIPLSLILFTLGSCSEKPTVSIDSYSQSNEGSQIDYLDSSTQYPGKTFTANWSVSKSTQLNVLKKLGGTPTRPSVLTEPEVVEARTRPSSMPNALTFDAVYDYGIKDPHFVLGPKIPEANEYYNILLTEVQRCLSGDTEPEEACNELKVQLDDLHEV